MKCRLRISNRRFWLKRFIRASIVLVIIVLLFNFIQYARTRYKNQLENESVAHEVVQVDKSAGKSSSLEQLSFEQSFVVLNEDLKRQIDSINRQQKVLNGDIYGTVDEYSLIKVVQVHSRIEYLKHLISSLRGARDINNALLIFSHDLLDENINALIQSINFCRVIQIFYPYAIQIYPNHFPGADSKKCMVNASTDGTIPSGCFNGSFINADGKQRSPQLTQIKHHWWWKANRVFNLKAVKRYDGPVLFLEEDLLVVEDFIPTMRLMYETAQRSCKNCKIFSLASSDDAVNIHRASYRTANQATITSIFNNLGLAFTKKVWAEIVDCAHTFCTFDDYNWDFSLKYVFTNCMKNTAAINLRSPRVFHIGVCGVHLSSAFCKADAKVVTIKNIIKKNRKHLYPKALVLYDKNDHKGSDSKHGGFSDPRDHALCMGMTIM